MVQQTQFDAFQIASPPSELQLKMRFLLPVTGLIVMCTVAQENQEQLLITNNHPFYHPAGYRSKPWQSQRLTKPSTYIARSVSSGSSLKILDADRMLPCCKDESGGSVCRAMKNNDPRNFANKCASEPDFSLIVCCKSCTELGTSHRERAANFFSPSNNATNCFDRMSAHYCSRFQTSSDAWNSKRWSCDTEHYRLGFRVCRSTCGFCNLDWKNAKEAERCMKP